MTGWLKASLLSAVAFLLPIKALALAALVLTCLDTVTGIWAARKRGEAITSAGFRRTIVKLACYLTALVAGHVVGVVLLGGLIPVAGLVAGAIGVAEFTSSVENVSTIVGRDLFRLAVARLGGSRPKPTDA